MTDPRLRSETVDILLAEHGVPSDAHRRASEHPCAGAKFHSPAPLVTVPYPVGGREVWLCPTCVSKLQCFLHLSHQAPDAMTWPVLREFSNRIRALGQEILGAELADEGPHGE